MPDAGSGVGFFYGYLHLAKGVIAPRVIDRKYVQPALKAEKDRLATAVDQLREKKQALQRAQAEGALEELRQEGLELGGRQRIEVEEASVVVGGVRLPVRRRGL